MLSRWARRWTPQFFHPIISALIRLGVTPNGLTIAGLIAAVLCGCFIAIDQLLIAAVFLVLSGLLDALDGELARQREQINLGQPANQLGSFIDSVADHYGDFAIYVGLAWRALHLNDPLTVYLVIAAMFGSLVGSHIRSRAGMVGVNTKNVGAVTRMERTLVLLFGLLSGWIAPALGVLALINNLSALQRLFYALRINNRG